MPRAPEAGLGALVMVMYPSACVVMTALLAGCVPARADVVERAAHGFTVRTVIAIDAPADRVFDALTREVGAWWDKEHTYSGDAANLSLSATPGGCFCEVLPQGGGVQHARVIHVIPGRLLRLSGALGPLQEAAVTGTWTWQFAAGQQGGTTATVTYTVAGYSPGGLEALAGPVDLVVGAQVRRLKAFVERDAR